jgi:antitoxin (DNA-binding transcriptional repressor) of toxin-antitoxin stability system
MTLPPSYPCIVQRSDSFWSSTQPASTRSGGGLRESTVGLTFNGVRTLSLEEAETGLGKWLELAMAGEAIRIRKGDAVVELRPISEKHRTPPLEGVSPREALRQLQAEARLTSKQAQEYLEEVHQERLAAE